MAEEKKTKEEAPEIIRLTYIFRMDLLTGQPWALTPDEFKQLIDKGIDPKHTSIEEVYNLCGWIPTIKIHYSVKGKGTFMTDEYSNWTSAYEADFFK
jgi:hypothetical protein